MDNQKIEQHLRDSLADQKLDNKERAELREILSHLSHEQARFIRNKAFDLVREQIKDPADWMPLLKWLESVIKTVAVETHQTAPVYESYFSPGQACRRRIVEFCRQARESLNICVFTISDDRITQEILNAHERGIKVAVISDNDKANDRGSDIDYLTQKGVAVCLDSSPHHMHHKFAICDQQWLLNGSFNWTRSASDFNQENITISNDLRMITSFSKVFDDLWEKYS
ncbi:phospholipase D-like domain-containing protein [Pleionea sp. CnH1-48]|uniref:phospholipase D-like domain-containing protein n=1 Tax=Pleionea sp. CnH1-48 TaxID=2954494 RepID=UPI002097EB11|nr:phospholipase D-like domain-containing protein [Pleionea sp. CnH1-48]MCO7223568.1 phospholipase D-like domain-containing protein [Pleionea sp. CnH1-48]